MRIAIIHQKYNPYGGGGRVLADIINYYAQDLNNQVTVIVRKWTGELLPNVSVVRLKSFSCGSLIRDLSFATKVRKYLSNQQFDIVISDQKFDFIDVYIAGGGVHKAFLKQKLKHSGFFAKINNYLRLFNYYTMFAEKKTFLSPQLKKVICVSGLVKRDILANYVISENKLAVVYNGIDTSKFSYDPTSSTRKQIRDALSLGNNFTLLFVGSGFERKGLKQCISVLEQLPNINLLIVGADKNTSQYINYAQEICVFERCRFLGPQDDVVKFYYASDAFILPSYYEPFGLVYLEALAIGVPVLVSNFSGAAELIEDGKHGYVIEYDNVADISAKVRLLSTKSINKQDCIELGNRCTVAKMVKDMNAAIFNNGL